MPRPIWLITRPNWNVSLVIDPRDIWVGVLWRRSYWVSGADGVIEHWREYPVLEIFVCLVPCFPIRFCHNRALGDG